MFLGDGKEMVGEFRSGEHHRFPPNRAPTFVPPMVKTSVNDAMSDNDTSVPGATRPYPRRAPSRYSGR
jgi:hypothetical protein